MPCCRLLREKNHESCSSVDPAYINYITKTKIPERNNLKDEFYVGSWFQRVLSIIRGRTRQLSSWSCEHVAKAVHMTDQGAESKAVNFKGPRLLTYFFDLGHTSQVSSHTSTTAGSKHLKHEPVEHFTVRREQPACFHHRCLSSQVSFTGVYAFRHPVADT